LARRQFTPCFSIFHFLSSFAVSSQGSETQQSLIDRLIWELVQLCAPQNDSAIQQMAGECLGELGAVDPYAIAFSFPHDASQSAGPERASKEQQTKAAKVRCVARLCFIYLSFFQYLWNIFCINVCWWGVDIYIGAAERVPDGR
jgi:hypothetical protein